MPPPSLLCLCEHCEHYNFVARNKLVTDRLSINLTLRTDPGCVLPTITVTKFKYTLQFGSIDLQINDL